MTRATRKEAPRSRVYPVKILAIDQFLPVLMTILIASLVDHIHNHSHNQSRLKFIFTIFIPDFKNILSLFDSGFQEFWGEKNWSSPAGFLRAVPGRVAGLELSLSCGWRQLLPGEWGCSTAGRDLEWLSWADFMAIEPDKTGLHRQKGWISWYFIGEVSKNAEVQSSYMGIEAEMTASYGHLIGEMRCLTSVGMVVPYF